MPPQPIRDIVVREGFSPIQVHYDHRAVGGEPLGHIVENRAIRTRPARPGADPADRDPGGTGRGRCARTAGGAGRGPARRRPQRWRAPGGLVRGAPVEHPRAGRHRRARNGPTVRPASSARSRHERPHDGLAVERFFPDGPFARLPMTGDRCSIVWALDDGSRASVLALDDEGFWARSPSGSATIWASSQLEGPRWSYPLALVMADRYTADRLALVGDAARGIHPIAGQGWNLALRDVAALAEIVVDRLRLGLDPGRRAGARALRRLAAVRRHGAGGGHRRHQPPVRQRPSAGAPGPRGRAGRGRPDAAAQALLHAPCHGSGRRPAAGHARRSRSDARKWRALARRAQSSGRNR